MRMNLSLIGFSGAGKSYIGRKIADALDLEFVDLDEVMEEEHGKPVTDILESLGDDGFVAYESENAIRRTAGKSGLLISTGGSIVYATDAMKHLRDMSTVVYLSVPYEIIEERVGDSADRLGRIVGLGDKTLRELYESREPLYKRYSHEIMYPERMTLEDMLARVRDLLVQVR